MDVQHNEIDLSGRQKLFSLETGVTARHTHFIGRHFCGKNLPLDKMPGRLKIVLDKTKF